ncbi:MAG: signal recognition particle-docking protein FtsY [Polaromonas sp.]|uniref:signal recognition particle-docking protein FtsY n=1 Tax=Polaromonas sp. TaxID=1869339 RepID=UPI00273082B7|nr:signal recognition particle-docking protein FtsY [Polaromonas sp.]MDP2256504.1 signal recognition particle-docking protein FtsY [Polaromonas sp.]MDP3706505.1 signal recognition particle-docking protein FtsY [Polaromonas sp.]
MFSFFKKKFGSAPPPVPSAPPATPAVQAPGEASGPATAPAPSVTARSPASNAGGAMIGSALVTPISIPEANAVVDTALPDRQRWLGKLQAGLRKTGASISTVFTGSRIDDALYEDLETALLMADTGVKATEHLLTEVKRRVQAGGMTHPVAVKNALIEAIAQLLKPLEKPLVIGQYQPTVIMVTGVNGAGKTTSIGKLTRHLANEGASVLLAAADTFRAAAREQLSVWADRNTVEIVSQAGGDPAAVSFDAVTAGKARGKDVVLVDTAGRLPTQLHLMEELRKIKRVVQKADATAPHEILLVIDGNTGQNALAQVKAFDDTLQLTGLIVTKLDGTAKGGVLAAIALWARERALASPDLRPVPVYFIGVGEKLEDLETFNAREFAQALLA